MRRAFYLLTINVMILLFAMGCGSESNTKSTSDAPDGKQLPAAPKGVIRINISSDPATYDPSLCADVPSHQVLSHLFEPLVRMDAQGRPIAGAAESWEHDDTYKIWTFHLRPNGKWSNGDAVTADDFVFGIERVLTPATQATMAMMVYSFLEGGLEYYESQGTAGADLLGILAIDDYTVEYTLNDPAPYFDSLVAHTAWYPLHRASVEKAGSNWSLKPETYVGNGPFILSEIRPKDRAILKKSETYWGSEEVKFNQVEMLFIEDNATQMAAYQSGDLDITNDIPSQEAAELMQSPEFHKSPMLGTYYIGFNTQKPPFDNRDLRRAMSLTIDRTLIVNKVARRGELPAAGLIPHGIPMPDGRDYREHAPAFVPADADLEKAKELLAKAGYSDENSVPRAEYLFNTRDLHKSIAQVLQAMWKENLGVRIELNNVEWGEFLKRMDNHDFTISRSSWIGDYLDPMTFLEIFETGHGKNAVGYSNERYDELLGMIRAETNPDKRLEYIIEAEQLLIEKDCVIAPIFEYNTPILIRSNIKGAYRTPLAGLDVSRAWREGE